MSKITIDNFDYEYEDSIERQEIDKFVCQEMARQMHRYIKGMGGTKQQMVSFEQQLEPLTVPQREEAIAQYVDFNREALSGLDFKVVLARAMANYCDTFDYLVNMVNNKRKMVFYLNRIKEKYVRFHTLFKQDGRLGMKNYEGKVVLKPQYALLQVCTGSADGLRPLPVIAAKNGKMGLVEPSLSEEDKVVAPFVFDHIASRNDYPFFEAVENGRRGFIGVDGKFEPCM